MGTFFVEALLAAPERPERRQPIELLVDSGSTHTWVGAALLRALSVAPTERRRVETIDGQVAERDAAEVLITPDGRTLHTVCLFGDGRSRRAGRLHARGVRAGGRSRPAQAH